MKQRHRASRLGGLLKRRLLPAILSLSMAVSLALPGVAAAAGGFETNLTNLHGLSGTWTAEDDGFHGTSAGGDNFAIADDVVGPTTCLSMRRTSPPTSPTRISTPPSSMG